MSRMIPVDLVDWDRFHRLARSLAFRIRESGFKPDMVVAIARGGYVPARVLCDYLGVMDLASFRVEHYRGARKEPLARVRHPLAVSVDGLRILVVDDVSDTGDTFEVALSHLSGLGDPAEVRTAALLHKTVSRYRPDYYVEEMVEWRWVTFPWAAMEDISEFVRELRFPPGTTLEEIAGKLRAAHGIEVPPAKLKDVLALLRS